MRNPKIIYCRDHPQNSLTENLRILVLLHNFVKLKHNMNRFLKHILFKSMFNFTMSRKDKNVLKRRTLHYKLINAYSFKYETWAHSFREASKTLHCMSTCFNIRYPFTYTCQNEVTDGVKSQSTLINKILTCAKQLPRQKRPQHPRKGFIRQNTNFLLLIKICIQQKLRHQFQNTVHFYMDTNN